MPADKPALDLDAELPPRTGCEYCDALMARSGERNVAPRFLEEHFTTCPVFFKGPVRMAELVRACCVTKLATAQHDVDYIRHDRDVFRERATAAEAERDRLREEKADREARLLKLESEVQRLGIVTSLAEKTMAVAKRNGDALERAWARLRELGVDVMP